MQLWGSVVYYEVDLFVDRFAVFVEQFGQFAGGEPLTHIQLQQQKHSPSKYFGVELVGAPGMDLVIECFKAELVVLQAVERLVVGEIGCAED